MINKKEMMIVSCLRKNARETLTKISRETGIPVSTIFDNIRRNFNNLVIKHTALIDFSKIGYSTRATITLKLALKEEKEAVKEYLLKNKSVNSFYKINNGYDFLVEGIFHDLSELEMFLDDIESKFKIVEKRVYYIIQELKREEFMANPSLSNFY
ncbi:MAG TPA: Lrp/AsnC family transcriptional regulator [Candidatus Nanoarchaeia archaeon]|nr:Lrp/AsnC family transcriptional regulator [Candidatus Nanoarchaeia archaeon]